MCPSPASDSAAIARMVDERVEQRVRELLRGGVLRTDVAPRSLPLSKLAQDGAALGMAPVWDGTRYVPGSVGATLAGLSDVDLSGIADTDILKYDTGTSKWYPSSDYATSTELSDHLVDAVDAHDASAISYAGGTGISATHVEGAIDELATEKANLDSPTFTGTPSLPTAATAVTQAEGDNDTSIATTAYVDRATGNASSARPACRVTRAAVQSVVTASEVALSFDTEVTDTDGMWVVGTPTRATIVTPGFYTVSGYAEFAANTTGRRIVTVKVNGAVVSRESAMPNTTGASWHATSHSLQLAASDYVEVYVLQDSGGNLNVTGSMSVAWVGGTGAAWGNAGARAARSLNQTLTTATHTSVLFDTEDWDVDGMHSTSSNTNRLTATVAGTYAITAMVVYTANATGDRGTRILKNGSEIVGYSLHAASTAPNTTRQTVTAIVQMVAGDYVEVTAYQASGGNLDIIGAGAGSERTTLSAVRVGYQTNPADLPGTYIASMYAANSGSPTHTSNGGWQKVGSGGGTLTWTSEIDKRPSGVSAQVDTATNKRIDIRKTGLYRVNWGACLSALAATKSFSVAVYVNGTLRTNAETVGSTAGQQVIGTRTLSLSSGDYLELYAYQNDSASEAYYVGGGSYNVYLQAEYLGPAT